MTVASIRWAAARWSMRLVRSTVVLAAVLLSMRPQAANEPSSSRGFASSATNTAWEAVNVNWYTAAAAFGLSGAPAATQRFASRSAIKRTAAVTPTITARQDSPPGGSTRGIFRFSTTDFAALKSAGFNSATDGGASSLGSQEAAAGLTGMVYLNVYDNVTCHQTVTDAAITSLVRKDGALTYQVGDEPTTHGCAAAPAYGHITSLVHAANPGARTWVADDEFNRPGLSEPRAIGMAGAVDVLAFDVYPCQTGPCDFSMIDNAVASIRAGTLSDWQFILQDFNSGPWRWPTPGEIKTQFQHWQGAGASGYWVFAWDYVGNVQPAGNVAALQSINGGAMNPQP